MEVIPGKAGADGIDAAVSGLVQAEHRAASPIRSSSSSQRMAAYRAPTFAAEARLAGSELSLQIGDDGARLQVAGPLR
jgi:hypothetical protein